jgi:hypothetical protein
MYAEIHAMAISKRDARTVKVDPDDTASVSAQKLNGELTEDAEANDDKNLAKRRLRTANTLQSDCAKCHGRGNIETDRVGNWHDQVLWHTHDFSVVGALSTGASDAVARRELGDALTNLNDHTCARVAGRQFDSQALLHQSPSRREAVGKNHVNDFLHM